MIKRTAIILILMHLAVPFAFGDVPAVFKPVSKEDIDRAIDKNKLEHPYLYFTEKDKPSILERINSDPDCKDIMSRLLAEANRLLYTPVNPTPPSRPKNTVYDNT